MSKLPYYLIVFLTATVIAGCGGRRTVDSGYEVEIDVVEGYAGDIDPTATGLGDDTALLGQRTIYFDYDSSILTAKGRAVMQAHARYLNDTPGARIILEGHADERGTREYNLALAEGRARSAARMMQAFGVAASRIQTVSYGEERPVALGHDDSAWARNRRVEVLYQ